MSSALLQLQVHLQGQVWGLTAADESSPELYCIPFACSAMQPLHEGLLSLSSLGLQSTYTDRDVVLILKHWPCSTVGRLSNTAHKGWLQAREATVDGYRKVTGGALAVGAAPCTHPRIRLAVSVLPNTERKLVEDVVNACL